MHSFENKLSILNTSDTLWVTPIRFLSFTLAND
jgi:hypothetical protein